MVFCPRCPEGDHPKETICFTPQAVDSTTLAIMVQLLEGRSIAPNHFPFLDVWAMAQYLILEEDYFLYISIETTLTPVLSPARE